MGTKGKEAVAPPVAAPPATPEAPPPAQEFVTPSMMQDFEQRMQARMQETLMQGFSEVLSRVQVPQAAPTRPTIPQVDETELEEHYAKAVEDGDGKKAAALLKQIRQLDRARSEAQLAQIQEWGTSQIDQLTNEVTVKGMPHWGRFESEINAQLAQLPPSQRADAKVKRIVYNAVLGAHAEELIAEAKQEAIRGIDEGGEGIAGRGSRNAPQLSPEDMADLEVPATARKTLSRLRTDEDAFARKLGFANWAAYQKFGRELEAKERERTTH